MLSKLFGKKPPRDGQNCGGVDFVERKRHGAEKKPPTLGVGGGKTALGQAKCWGVFVAKTARGGKMRAKLFVGKPPQDGQNSAGVDFGEGKGHGAEKKPPWLMGRKPPWVKKMDRELVGRKRHWGKQIVGEFWGENGTWWKYAETARGRKKASKIVQVKTALG
ncbi:hypothetical protein T11_9336 [Trichinella zimbabwensis]|uniref:Uncharacterized protein n=1 Tax=Trichinella zimbabwensis TaxID=268475 RepID=A0A0V1GL79_9BILA|nr:hypothetical protein T11_9336 [Trichinella zimbabwensis]